MKKVTKRKVTDRVSAVLTNLRQLEKLKSEGNEIKSGEEVGDTF